MIHTVITSYKNNTAYLVWAGCKVHNPRGICLNYCTEWPTFWLSQQPLHRMTEETHSRLSFH